MKRNLEKELDKNRFFLVKNGLFIIALVLSLILIVLSVLTINNQSVLKLVFDYYFR